MNKALWIALVATLLISAISCREEDERLARFAAESTRQQAGQNREMSQLNREVANAHKDLVRLHHDLEEQQTEVNRQRDQLESEQRDIAGQRCRDSIIAAAIRSAGLVLACLVPLGLAAYLLHCLHDQRDDPLVTELLIEEITSKQPMLLPPPQDGIARMEDPRKPEPLSLGPANDDQEVDSAD